MQVVGIRGVVWRMQSSQEYLLSNIAAVRLCTLVSHRLKTKISVLQVVRQCECADKVVFQGRFCCAASAFVQAT